jgi:hypothetical protein
MNSFNVFLCILAVMFGAGASQAQVPKAVITSDYYSQPKVLVLHALNNSGKDITGYTFIIRHKNPDGTIDKGGFTGYTSDMRRTPPPRKVSGSKTSETTQPQATVSSWQAKPAT